MDDCSIPPVSLVTLKRVLVNERYLYLSKVVTIFISNEKLVRTYLYV